MSFVTPTPDSVLDTTTEPAVMTPAVRFLRTLLQVIVALAAVTAPAAAAANLSGTTTALVTGIMGAAVIIISALHNAFNQFRSNQKG